MTREALADTEALPSLDAAALSRHVRELRQIAVRLSGCGVHPLNICEALLNGRFADAKARDFFSGLPQDEKHYWISSLYALLMPKGRRQRLAAYFTPPHLVAHALDLLCEEGLRPGKDRILDPSSGGAAFLVPLAARIATDGKRNRRAADETLRKIEATLHGIEIEPHLVRLSHILLSDLLRQEIRNAGRLPDVQIRRCNTLRQGPPEHLYDAVVGNPPYGRIFRPSKILLQNFEGVIASGYVNQYALFIEQSLRWVRPGGLVCLIVPLSFVGGPNFASLRKRILQTAHVLRLDPIDKRSDVFLDVLYDVGVLLLRKRDDDAVRASVARSALIKSDEAPQLLGKIDLPARPSGRVWALPDGILSGSLFQGGLQTLSDYGYIARAGYFVWNRERERYRSGLRPRAREVPLFWAHNVRANAVCSPQDRENDLGRIGFVKFAGPSSAVVHGDAIILQRTSNRRQRRRLIAGIIRSKKVPGQNGFVSENHTILILADPSKPQTVTLKTLCRLLNTAAVDARFRRISGSVSVSTQTLRDLPLPASDAVRTFFAGRRPDDEAAEAAYDLSTERPRVVPKPRRGNAR